MRPEEALEMVHKIIAGIEDVSVLRKGNELYINALYEELPLWIEVKFNGATVGNFVDTMVDEIRVFVHDNLLYIHGKKDGEYMVGISLENPSVVADYYINISDVKHGIDVYIYFP